MDTATVTAALLELAYDKPRSGVVYETWAPLISEVAHVYHLNDAKRLASFLAQIGHESGRLRFTRELWGPTAQQRRYEPGTSLAVTLGNTQPGDGRRFRGHGLIQVTGRANHAAMRNKLRKRFKRLAVPDFEVVPEALALPVWAAFSAGEFWHSRNLNALADVGDQRGICTRVNGGTNGLADRLALYSSALGACLLHGW